MSPSDSSAKSASFGTPEGVLVGIMGALLIAAASVGTVMAALMRRHPDLKTILLIAIGFVGICSLGLAMINVWRRPMLTMRPGVVTIPTLLGTRDIPTSRGQPVGKYLASSARSDRGGSVEGNKFVHFFLRDERGRMVNCWICAAMRRNCHRSSAPLLKSPGCGSTR